MNDLDELRVKFEIILQVLQLEQEKSSNLATKLQNLKCEFMIRGYSESLFEKLLLPVQRKYLSEDEAGKLVSQIDPGGPIAKFREVSKVSGREVLREFAKALSVSQRLYQGRVILFINLLEFVEILVRATNQIVKERDAQDRLYVAHAGNTSHGELHTEHPSLIKLTKIWSSVSADLRSNLIGPDSIPQEKIQETLTAVLGTSSAPQSEDSHTSAGHSRLTAEDIQYLIQSFQLTKPLNWKPFIAYVEEISMKEKALAAQQGDDATRNTPTSNNHNITSTSPSAHDQIGPRSGLGAQLDSRLDSGEHTSAAETLVSKVSPGLSLATTATLPHPDPNSNPSLAAATHISNQSPNQAENNPLVGDGPGATPSGSSVPPAAAAATTGTTSSPSTAEVPPMLSSPEKQSSAPLPHIDPCRHRGVYKLCRVWRFVGDLLQDGLRGQPSLPAAHFQQILLSSVGVQSIIIPNRYRKAGLTLSEDETASIIRMFSAGSATTTDTNTNVDVAAFLNYFQGEPAKRVNWSHAGSLPLTVKTSVGTRGRVERMTGNKSEDDEDSSLLYLKRYLIASEWTELMKAAAVHYDPRFDEVEEGLDFPKMIVSSEHSREVTRPMGAQSLYEAQPRTQPLPLPQQPSDEIQRLQTDPIAFMPAEMFLGRKQGYKFQKGESGTGYYLDTIGSRIETRDKLRHISPEAPPASGPRDTLLRPGSSPPNTISEPVGGSPIVAHSAGDNMNTSNLGPPHHREQDINRTTNYTDKVPPNLYHHPDGDQSGRVIVSGEGSHSRMTDALDESMPRDESGRDAGLGGSDTAAIKANHLPSSGTASAVPGHSTASESNSQPGGDVSHVKEEPRDALRGSVPIVRTDEASLEQKDSDKSTQLLKKVQPNDSVSRDSHTWDNRHRHEGTRTGELVNNAPVLERVKDVPGEAAGVIGIREKASGGFSKLFSRSNASQRGTQPESIKNTAIETVRTSLDSKPIARPVTATQAESKHLDDKYDGVMDRKSDAGIDNKGDKDDRNVDEKVHTDGAEGKADVRSDDKDEKDNKFVEIRRGEVEFGRGEDRTSAQPPDRDHKEADVAGEKLIAGVADGRIDKAKDQKENNAENSEKGMRDSTSEHINNKPQGNDRNTSLPIVSAPRKTVPFLALFSWCSAEPDQVIASDANLPNKGPILLTPGPNTNAGTSDPVSLAPEPNILTTTSRQREIVSGPILAASSQITSNVLAGNTLQNDTGPANLAQVHSNGAANDRNIIQTTKPDTSGFVVTGKQPIKSLSPLVTAHEQQQQGEEVEISEARPVPIPVSPRPSISQKVGGWLSTSVSSPRNRGKTNND